MKKLQLRSVTLLAATTRDHASTLAAIHHCRRLASFAGTVYMSDRNPLNPLLEFMPLNPFTRHADLCPWSMTALPRYRHLFSDFVLSIHHDGYIINPESWTDDFLAYDFVGGLSNDSGQMNNGFYLSSRRFWWALEQMKFPATVDACHPSDLRITGEYRPALEALGVRFAPPALAFLFCAARDPWCGQFGAHGAVPLGTTPPLNGEPDDEFSDWEAELEHMRDFVDRNPELCRIQRRYSPHVKRTA